MVTMDDLSKAIILLVRVGAVARFMLFTLYVPASAASTNEAMSYDTVASLNSSFGTVYYIEHPNERLTRTVWDVLDVVMAGASWAEFFGEPSFANLGWAVLDTVDCRS